MGSFRHDPLPNDISAIRLIRVQRDTNAGFLSCRISESEIIKDSYIALSYVWGKDLATHRILINEIEYWVKPNLWGFLVHAREHFADQNIWIDALCIDQSHAEEKNLQVPRMGEIFGKARGVIAWLQTSTPRLMPQTKMRDGAQSLAETICSPTETLPQLDADIALAALARLATHEYWSRAWIMQEVCLAQKVELRWEGMAILWQDLRAYLRKRDGKTPSLQSNYEKLSIYLLRHHATDMKKLGIAALIDFTPKDISISQSSHRASETLLDLAIRFRSQACSVRHDHVLAYLGLRSDEGKFMADYKEPSLELLLRVGLTASQPIAPNQARTLANLLQINHYNAGIRASREWTAGIHGTERYDEFPRELIHCQKSSKLHKFTHEIFAAIPGSTSFFIFVFDENTDREKYHFQDQRAYFCRLWRVVDNEGDALFAKHMFPAKPFLCPDECHRKDIKAVGQQFCPWLACFRYSRTTRSITFVGDFDMMCHWINLAQKAITSSSIRPTDKTPSSPSQSTISSFFSTQTLSTQGTNIVSDSSASSSSGTGMQPVKSFLTRTASTPDTPTSSADKSAREI